MQALPRTIFNDEHEQFRSVFRSWLEHDVVPNHGQWEDDGIVPRELWLQAGKHGFLGMTAPAAYGGGGSDDPRFGLIVVEEISRAGIQGSGGGIYSHNEIVLPYLVRLCDEEQAGRWLPGMISGECIGAVAMTEPNTGSDLGGIATTARRDGDVYVVNGAKTFISNGILADLIVTVVKTDPSLGHKGISLLAVERDTLGFSRGRNLDKLGQHAQDTAELFFDDAEVPCSNLLGEEGQGFAYLSHTLAHERLTIAVASVAGAEAALRWTLDYVRDRRAFGQAIGQFQNTKFVLAEMAAATQAARVYVDRCVELACDGQLTPEQAAAVKLYSSELQNHVTDRCLQLHGGYGYMREYPIARTWVDARAMTIYGGTSEIMKEIIGRSLVGRPT